MADRWVVTPEAVVLELPLAELPTRALARMLDFMVQFVFLALASLAWVSLVMRPVMNRELALVVGLLISMFGVFCIQVLQETLLAGRTLGKWALGIRVLTTEGVPIRFRHAAIRAAFELVEMWLVPVGFIGMVAVFFSQNRQRLGDWAAGTLVVRERAGVRAFEPTRFEVPPHLAEVASTIDVAAMPEDLYVTVRNYLMRCHDMLPGTKQWVGEVLARATSTRLRVARPAGLAPEPFLLLVAARHQAQYRHGDALIGARPFDNRAVLAPPPQLWVMPTSQRVAPWAQHGVVHAPGVVPSPGPFPKEGSGGAGGADGSLGRGR